MIIAIHQPNFLPNSAFFAKMLAADKFIILDTAQFPTEGWVHRNKLLSNKEAGWVTLPVLTSGRGTQKILDVEIRHTTPWQRKLLKRIEQEYSQAPYKDVVASALADILDKSHLRLVDLNMELLAWFRKELRVEVPMFVASEMDKENDLKSDEANPTTRLIDLVQALEGKTYLSGPSGRKYLDADAFKDAGINLEYQEFSAAPYENGSKEFVEGLSFLDMMLWLGPEKALQMVWA